MSKRINIGFNILERNSPDLGSLFKQIRFMNTLGTRQNFLPADKEIIGIGQFWIFRVGHGVKWTNRQRVLVHKEKVRLVFFLDNVTQFLFIFGRQIFEIILFHTGHITQQLASFCIREFECWSQVLQILKWMLLSYTFQFIFAAFIETIKNGNKQITVNLKNFIVMFLNHHFQIQTSKFTQVTTCVGLFCAENRPRGKDPFKSRTGCRHLFVQLGALRQTSLLAKVIQGEDIRSTFRCSTNQFGRMDFNKALFN
mmetsp:Transcript_9352/g.12406  ORF Transcript_9352/g.12406 Transcript_9352/m.12406 type:complete len:254 (+) Transcript_9352:280-1041(+)